MMSEGNPGSGRPCADASAAAPARAEPGRSVCVRTYGCQMNKLDSELVCGALRAAGYRITPELHQADVILFNTCSVREHAEQRVFSNLGALKRLKQGKAELVIGVLGCMAQQHGEAIRRRAPHVDLVAGTGAIGGIVELLKRAALGPVVALNGAGERLDSCGRERTSAERPLRHSAYVAISRGCDNRCAYCVVPNLRGPEVSRAPREIEEEVGRLVADGCKEIILLGQNVDSYGRDLKPPQALADLLCRLDGTAGLKRLRFVTSHPRFISRRLLEAMGDLASVCEHLHLPAQSGSNRILAAMRRGYTRERYLELVAEARERVPGLAIASDFIVGFPGESAEDFDQTARLVEQVRFQNCFIFKYSPRPGTAAAALKDDVPEVEKQRRNLALLALQQEVSRAENARFIGKAVEVLADGPSRRTPRGQTGATLTGRLRTNHIAVFPAETAVAGELVRVAIESASALTLFGRLAHGERS